MKVIPFPSGGSASPDEAWLAELEAALSGTGEGPRADSWRELREDVRALAPPMTPEFEERLREQIARRGAPGRPLEVSPAEREAAGRVSWLRRHNRFAALGAVAAAVGVVVVALVTAGPRPTGRSVEAVPAPRLPQSALALPSVRASGSASAGTTSNEPVAGGAAATPGRVQQLAASIGLTATPGELQATADRVARLAVSSGGFVQSSHVHVGEGAAEATLDLSLPSAKLSAALASLGQLAPVRAESQSLQDITNTYDADRQRLGDATAERQALLRALSRATTEGQIDSLRERLSQAGGAIAQARSALQAVSRRASTAEVEVTILGAKNAGGEGLSLHRGLHDAGRVLVVTLAVLLIAAAVLVPLALVLAALATGRRAWRRYRRERVLDAG